MNCNNWYEIKELIEDIIIDNGNINGKYFKYIDVLKKRKNLEIVKSFDRNNNSFKLLNIEKKNNLDINLWCLNHNLPNYDENCINYIKNDNNTKQYFNKKIIAGIPEKIHLSNIDLIIDKFLGKKISDKNRTDLIELLKPNLPKFIDDTYNLKCKSIFVEEENNESNIYYKINNIIKNINNKTKTKPILNNPNPGDFTIIVLSNDISELKCKKGDAFITYYTHEYEYSVKSNKTNPINKNNEIYDKPFIIKNNIIYYSVIKDKFNDKKILEKMNHYYWISPENYLYYYDRNKNDDKMILKIEINDIEK